MKLFIENIGKVLSYETIIEEIWFDYEFNKVDALKT
ncbi:helix-turn-helix domain-containing protein [Malaciobacter pacificus]|nr:helix-turn-helix domain-containing protein [Malaciobacter pacificus]